MVLEILEKNSRFWNFFPEILNFLKVLKIMSYNFQSKKQILTLGGVYYQKTGYFWQNFEDIVMRTSPERGVSFYFVFFF